MSPPRRPWTWVVLAGASGVLLLRVVWPEWPAWLPACLFHQATGLHCPGCGGTRCAVRLLEGDVAGAFAMNAAVALVAAVTALVTLLALWREWRGGSYRPLPAWLARGVAGFVILFALTRNLPWWPFTLLVPH